MSGIVSYDNDNDSNDDSIQFCRVASGQKVKKKLGDQELAQLVRSSAVAPAERRRKICEIHAQNNFTDDPMLQNLRFNIDKNVSKWSIKFYFSEYVTSLLYVLPHYLL